MADAGEAIGLRIFGKLDAGRLAMATKWQHFANPGRPWGYDGALPEQSRKGRAKGLGSNHLCHGVAHLGWCGARKPPFKIVEPYDAIGSTADSDSVSLGSNPGSPANPGSAMSRRVLNIGLNPFKFKRRLFRRVPTDTD